MTISLDERAERIGAVMDRAANEIGAELAAAKAEHPDSFMAWVDEKMPFTYDTANRLMAIHRLYSKATPEMQAALPAGRTALYELTRLPPDRLQYAIDHGLVTPDTTVTEAKVLRGDFKRREAPARPVLTVDVICQELLRRHPDDLTRGVYDDLTHWVGLRKERAS